MLFKAFIVCLALSVAGLAFGQAPASRNPAAPAPTVKIPPVKSAWERIVMIGASATAGFTETEPLGGPNTEKFRLGRYVDAALLVPHEPARTFASTFFFLQPEAEARRQVDAARQARPTLVVGLDFLFWFCYGSTDSEAERVKRFETGLKFLEEIPGPLVVGDIPDASAAADMLTPEMIPSAATRAAANRRLKEWAAARKQVTVVSLAEFMRAALANQALTVHGRTFPAGKTRGLLQADKLHPSTRGCTALALAILEALRPTQPASFTNDIRWDWAEVQRLGSGTTNSTVTPVVPAKQN